MNSNDTPRNEQEGRAEDDSKKACCAATKRLQSPLGFDEETQKRFWSCVAVGKKNECWPWKSLGERIAYGNFHDGKITMHTHRVAWYIANGPIPDGMFILHSCNWRPCCNPSHLRVGNQSDNIIDAYKAGVMPIGDEHWTRKNKEMVRFGEDHKNSILKEWQVIEIRRLYASGLYTQLALGVKFGVDRTAVGSIVRRESWPHI